MRTKKAETPEWREFEMIVAEIQRALVPLAKVEHNVTEKDATGCPRQIDALITPRAGIYSKKSRTVVECKLYKHPVDIGVVEAFVTKCHDLQKAHGVIVAHKFTEGARLKAEHHGIHLMTFRQARKEDWRKILGDDGYATMTLIGTKEERAFYLLEGDTEEHTCDFSHRLYDAEGEELVYLGVLFAEIKSAPHALGMKEARVGFRHPLFLEPEGTGRVAEVVFRWEPRYLMLSVPMEFGEGEVMEDAHSEQQIYKRVATAGFDWRELLAGGGGVEISEEEYLIAHQGEGTLIQVPLENLKRFLRFEVTQKVEGNDG